jgi:heme/copper-type cytochrome/quinol oxidase subunit 4
MNNSYEKLLGMQFAENAQTDPTDQMCQRVMQKIEHRELGRIRRRAFGFGLMVIVTILAFIPAINYLSRTFVASGLGQYSSLLSSDGSYVMAHWQDLAMSIGEALPATALMMILVLVILCLLALRWFMRYQASLNVHQHHLAAAGSHY